MCLVLIESCTVPLSDPPTSPNQPQTTHSTAFCHLFNNPKMEQVGLFLHDRRHLSLEVMLNAFSYVVVCEQSKGFVTATDLKTGILLCFGRQSCTSTELMVYSTLILESCLHAQLCTGGDLCLTVRKHINDPARFIESLVTILSVDKRNLPALESLKIQQKEHIACKMGSNSGQLIGNNTAQCPEPPGDQICGPEIPEPIVRFLARVRRSGMDILFPQNTHDKVLVCILMAIKAFKVPPAHRDLIELVMVVKVYDQLIVILNLMTLWVGEWENFWIGIRQQN